MQNAIFAMASFPSQLIIPICLPVEFCSPFNDFLYSLHSFFYHYLNNIGIAEPISGYERVLYMFFETIFSRIHYPCYTALGVFGVGFVSCRFSENKNFFLGELLCSLYCKS